MRGKMCLHVSFGKWSKQGKGVENFDHLCFLSLSSLLPYAVIQCVTMQTPHSVTVAALTGSLDCLVIQLKQWGPKNPRHISIMVLTERRDATAPGNIRARTRVICMSITSQNPWLSTWGEESQFEAPLHIQHPPTTHTYTLHNPFTPESWQKKNWGAKHFGRQEMV